MKIIHRYIIREFLEAFVFGLVVFAGILLLDQIFQLVNLVLSKGISFLTVFKLFFLLLPNILTLAIPMAVLFGILLAYGRLSEDNEITAMRATGLSYASFTSPLMISIVLLSFFLAYFNQYLSPLTHRRFRTLYQEILTQRPLLKFEEKEITTIGDYRLYVNRIDRTSNVLHGINIYKFSEKENESAWRISAASSTVTVAPDGAAFFLYNGYWQKPNPAHPENLVHLHFLFYQFTIPFGGNILPQSQSLREMSAPRLLAEIRDYRAKRMPTNFLENEYWLRYVLACAPLVFALAAVPLGISTQRGGRSIGFGLSLLIIFGYYLLLVMALNLGEKGFIRPQIILWLPDAAVLIAGLFFWRRMLRR